MSSGLLATARFPGFGDFLLFAGFRLQAMAAPECFDEQIRPPAREAARVFFYIRLARINRPVNATYTHAPFHNRTRIMAQVFHSLSFFLLSCISCSDSDT